jgi:hypothetical protein
MVPIVSATGTPEAAPDKVKLPAPTAWPIVLAFGVTLLFAGLLTSASVSILGAIFIVTGCVGWFREVLPHEKEEMVEVRKELAVVSTSRHKVERLQIAPDLARPLIPLEIYPVSAGIRGGLAGSVAMAVLACLYGLVKQRSIWYPINLLASTASAHSYHFDMQALSTFHVSSFSLAVVIHLITSLLVGLLYGAMLPMFPRRPILLGGIIAPILWTGLLHSILGIINPQVEPRIDWPWFIASQFAFGIVAGCVVARQERLHVHQFHPFVVRAGIEAPGLKEEKSDRNESR